ncbi:MAG TPA: hypothetical protein PKE12_15425 [Kiritimatiellia bacterium]|nr:hypothetical protein [Kiritimatiellia bacterium]
MRHFASPRIWTAYERLPPDIQRLADKSFTLLKADPRHPSPCLKKVDGFWSARVGLAHRALAVECDQGLLWFWIGDHAEYDRLIS